MLQYLEQMASADGGWRGVILMIDEKHHFSSLEILPCFCEGLCELVRSLLERWLGLMCDWSIEAIW